MRDRGICRGKWTKKKRNKKGNGDFAVSKMYWE